MYRIEVSPGEETVFRTIEELATGIRNGVITSRSRVYHGASAKWLPIEFHPHYKKAADLAAHPPSATEPSRPTPAPTPAQRHSAPVAVVEPPPEPVVQPISSPAISNEPELVLPKISYPEVPQDEPASEAQPLFRSRRKMGRRPLMLAAAVAVVAVGARFMLAAAPPASEPELPTATLGSSPVHVPEPKPVAPPVPKPVAKPAPAPAPAASSPPKPVEPMRPVEPVRPLRPTVPGPAFAPALPSTSVPVKPAARPPASAKVIPSSVDSASTIEPAPAQIDLSLPGAVPSTDSISLVSKSADSNAIRRILKAVAGPKAQPSKAGAR